MMNNVLIISDDVYDILEFDEMVEIGSPSMFSSDNSDVEIYKLRLRINQNIPAITDAEITKDNYTLTNYLHHIFIINDGVLFNYTKNYVQRWYSLEDSSEYFLKTYGKEIGKDIMLVPKYVEDYYKKHLRLKKLNRIFD